MKCATSTLHEQLAAQSGIFMSTPKEPNFFSNDEVYARGLDWYAGLFAAADGPLCGESSTHYTKLPTYPKTLHRMRQHVPDAKLIYVMRHPIDRLISQYIHEWTQRVVNDSVDRAIATYPALIDYSRYSMQLRPFLDTYGPDRVLPVFFERMLASPQSQLERVCRFIGYPGQPAWRHDLEAQNVSQQRLRHSPLRDAIVDAPVLRGIRRHLVPQRVRDYVKSWWRLSQRPQLSDNQQAELREIFDEDLTVLGRWLGLRLSCDSFKQVVTAADDPLWTDAAA